MKTWTSHLVAVATLGLTVAGAGSAYATLDMQKQAKTAGIEVTGGCVYCHVDKMPKKDAHAVNARGQWLLDKKKEKKADKIDMAWLKDYVEKK
jgi:hypothetical protein